jgi:hypothetical protein
MLSTVIKSVLFLVALFWRSSRSSHARVSRIWYVTKRDPLGALVAGLDDLWRYYKFLLHNEEAGVVLVSAAVVGARSDRDALSTCKSVNAIRTDLVCANQNR